jgi:hypothetical protein
MGKASREKQERKSSQVLNYEATVQIVASLDPQVLFRIAAVKGICESIKLDDLEATCKWIEFFELQTGEKIFDIELPFYAPDGSTQHLNVIAWAAGVHALARAKALLTMASNLGHEAASDFMTFAMPAIENRPADNPGYRTITHVLEWFFKPKDYEDAKKLLDTSKRAARFSAMSALIRRGALDYIIEHEKMALESVLPKEPRRNRVPSRI